MLGGTVAAIPTPPFGTATERCRHPRRRRVSAAVEEPGARREVFEGSPVVDRVQVADGAAARRQAKPGGWDRGGGGCKGKKGLRRWVGFPSGPLNLGATKSPVLELRVEP